MKEAGSAHTSVFFSSREDRMRARKLSESLKTVGVIPGPKERGEYGLVVDADQLELISDNDISVFRPNQDGEMRRIDISSTLERLRIPFKD